MENNEWTVVQVMSKVRPIILDTSVILKKRMKNKNEVLLKEKYKKIY